ncbi:MYXO-CTERM sorting domain-containing protein [Polyangium sorediatum]|uniref:MYXO-CTERM sorting domain-containing protein n=1 Tax=Polyangium sorediatum TaxID=889274 RepID=A0ABT6NPA9_9BACT|nr:MYXO-CTERM sorting domain-containing protein [Polyangium sorediatum]MDI1430143.1 MYXO-CTERM sorting domain-containing protein [Polyangium sorediatum]
MFPVVVSSFLGAAVLCASGAAFAAVTQPNGTVIPVNGGAALSGYINGSVNNDNINEGIDVVQDAAVEPQVFSPLCDFSGKYIAKGGGANFAVGWYNVDDSVPSENPPKYVPVDLGANLNMAAPNSDIQILFPFSGALPPPDQVNLSAVSIRENPAYKGGYIGFVLIPNPNGTGNGNATQYHYTEHRFNVTCTLCSNPGPWYSDLIYKSKMLANTFYLGFEDLDFMNAAGAAGVNGNDLDYEDFLFRFTGVACPGAGQPCDVPGAQGACAKGISDCDAQGTLICKPVLQPGSQGEACDAIDNDCDGLIDDDATCPPETVCNGGTCVASCESGEFPCLPSFVCKGSLCIEESCANVVCPEGEVCDGGACRAPCAGVVCPAGQVCSGDHCVDPCTGVTCGEGQVCVSGVCIPGCACRTCATGESCHVDSGQCVESACLGVTCEAGTHCKAGACVDLCDGVTCPPGEACQAGQCAVDVPSATSSSSTGNFVGSGGAGGEGGAGGAGGVMAGGGTSAGGAPPGSGESGSCGCRIESAAPTASGTGLSALLAALLFARRRSGGRSNGRERGPRLRG